VANGVAHGASGVLCDRNDDNGGNEPRQRSVGIIVVARLRGVGLTRERVEFEGPHCGYVFSSGGDSLQIVAEDPL